MSSGHKEQQIFRLVRVTAMQESLECVVS